MFSRQFGAMRNFVAGATGAVGRRLVPLLTAAGHEVVGLTRSPAKVGLLRRIGATPAIADALNRAAVMDAVQREKPEIVVHELTSIKKVDLRNFDRGFTETNRLRTEMLIFAAARAAGVRRFIRSFAGWPYARAGGPVKTEEDPLDPEPPPAFRRTLEAIGHLEFAVTGETGLEGVVLRYGSFYGPGTAISEQGWMVNDIRKRRVPVIGGGGVWSFIHRSTTPPASRVPRSRAGRRGFITSWMTILPPCRNGCPPWRRRSAQIRRAGSPPGSPVS